MISDFNFRLISKPSLRHRCEIGLTRQVDAYMFVDQHHDRLIETETGGERINNDDIRADFNEKNLAAGP